MKRELKVTIHYPTDPEDIKAYNERWIKAHLDLWAKICPKELQTAALDKCIKELKAASR